MASKKIKYEGTRKPFIPFKQFLQKMFKKDMLSKSMLLELVGEKTARRIMDGADNEMGAPTLGSTTGVVLQGQIHEYTGAVDDIKSQIANHWERIENTNIKAKNTQPNSSPELKEQSAPQEKSPNWPPKPN